MQDHQHAGHSNSGGGPALTGNESTPVITCAAHGTMRTGGTCSQCQATGTASIRAMGPETAGQQIITQADAGMTPDAIARRQEDIVASLLSDAQTPGQQVFAREYADTVGTYVRDLRELDGPGLTPGTPHPDPYLAAKGWHVCGHGIYTRHPDGQLDAEPEAC
jgi:hypothetical protein